MRRIIIAVTNDLATDQRVDRTCRALTDIGWHTGRASAARQPKARPASLCHPAHASSLPPLRILLC